MEMNKQFAPMKPIMGGLLEPPVLPSPESLMWENVLRVIITNSTEGKTMDETLEMLEKIYEKKQKKQ